ncbi:hypothetical protein M3665_27755, partial [Bacillus licheniformis]|nr:hypothetical protein [Bacillus licheniformis]
LIQIAVRLHRLGTIELGQLTMFEMTNQPGTCIAVARLLIGSDDSAIFPDQVRDRRYARVSVFVP